MMLIICTNTAKHNSTMKMNYAKNNIFVKIFVIGIDECNLIVIYTALDESQGNY